MQVSTEYPISNKQYRAGQGEKGQRGVEKKYSQLWLQYRFAGKKLSETYQPAVRHICCLGDSPVVCNAATELMDGASALTGGAVLPVESVDQDGTVILGTVDRMSRYLPERQLGAVKRLGREGYFIERVCLEGRPATVITSNSDVGVLYGVFHFLRLMQTGEPIDALRIREAPAVPRRMLNHWDDENGFIERGYGGRSLWKWDELPDTVSPRYRDHARLCASIGINGLVLNNVNANPRILRSDFLQKVRVLADVFREWGIKTYLSVNFRSPCRTGRRPGIGELDTADPLDPGVQAWWRDKAAEIYQLIPDFGGFLVKADCEGEPGPKQYNRSHIDGANMLASVLAQHGGTLIWRAFVYGKSDDRACDAYNEFKPFDGRFLDNVILQIKNGPIDFQPCEPFTPLFGGMPATRLSLELQIAKEYLGHATTCTYLGPMWRDILQTDTYAEGEGSSMARMLKGDLKVHRIECIAGVANTGDEPEWCGHPLNPANWYAFGRLAWDPELGSEAILDEWIAMSVPCDTEVRATIRGILMASYDTLVNYCMPLGLNHICDGNHYDPNPEVRGVFHNADAVGLGVDRTSTGSNAAGQYHPERAAIWGDRERIPLKYLLWFHHVPWHETLPTGRTLWEELKHRYSAGVDAVDDMIQEWSKLEDRLPADLYATVAAKLDEEKCLAQKWSETCVQYFSQFSEDQETV